MCHQERREMVAMDVPDLLEEPETELQRPSVVSLDGTWEPYPTCQGDLRETRDGCDGCPGPAGGARNRTAEAILTRNTASDRRVPKIITNNGERKSVPSFAGNINIGRLEPQDTRFNQAARPRPVPTTTTT